MIGLFKQKAALHHTIYTSTKNKKQKRPLLGRPGQALLIEYQCVQRIPVTVHFLGPSLSIKGGQGSPSLYWKGFSGDQR